MGKPKKEAKQDVIKHSSAIQIQNKITLLQRCAWNVLLANAYDELPIQEIHQISVQNLILSLEFNSKNDDYLKESIKALVSCSVEWNILDKDGEAEWGVTTLLAQAKIRRGICTYAYSPELRQRLHNPRMYARLCLALQNKFESKHALALWELCTDYLGSSREYGETPYITIDDFRKLMGIDESDYYSSLFKKLKQKIITPALSEINRVSDFRVTVDYQRQGRKVTALKFKIRRVALLPEALTGQGKLFPELDDMPVVVRELKDVGMSAQDAWEIWQQGFSYVHEGARPTGLGDGKEAAFVQYIREKIHLLKRRQASGKVDNSTGFLLAAIRQNYANPEYEDERQRAVAREEQQAKREREQRVQALEAHKAEIEHACNKALNHLSSQVAAAAPGVLDQAAAELLASHDGFRFIYNRGKSALENYQSRVALQGFFLPYLERQAPERFETVRQHYAAQIAALESEMASLQAR